MVLHVLQQSRPLFDIWRTISGAFKIFSLFLAVLILSIHLLKLNNVANIVRSVSAKKELKLLFSIFLPF